MNQTINLGDIVYWDKRAMTVTGVDIPGEYGPRIELDGRLITTPSLDHRFSRTANAAESPSLYSLMWGVL